MTKQKAYVQFSKRIVLLVTIAVTVISLLAMVLCFFRSDTEELVSTVRTYINYGRLFSQHTAETRCSRSG